MNAPLNRFGDHKVVTYHEYCAEAEMDGLSLQEDPTRLDRLYVESGGRRTTKEVPVYEW